MKDERYAICGGGFPIIVNGETVGAICVSGLPHEQVSWNGNYLGVN
ncbi:MAG: heme-binding protein [Bacillus sp. (in: firmicutes)]